jgi:hypothetical protein
MKIDEQSARADKTKALLAIEVYLHFNDFPRLSISLKRYRSEAAAWEAFEWATSTCVVILFTSCWALFIWPRKSRISDNSPAEGAHLSVTAAVGLPAEDPPTISY